MEVIKQRYYRESTHYPARKGKRVQASNGTTVAVQESSPTNDVENISAPMDKHLTQIQKMKMIDDD